MVHSGGSGTEEPQENCRLTLYSVACVSSRGEGADQPSTCRAPSVSSLLLFPSPLCTGRASVLSHNSQVHGGSSGQRGVKGHSGGVQGLPRRSVGRGTWHGFGFLRAVLLR